MRYSADGGRELGAAFWRRRSRVRFGQTRDDVGVERRLAVLHGGVRRAFVITSGGCAAFSLLDVVDDEILSVDIHPAQNRLAELKLAAWRQGSFSRFERLLCGDARRVLPALRADLPERVRAYWDRHPEGLRHGLQSCGRVDGFLRLMRRLLFVAVHRRTFVERFLSLDDPAVQSAWFAERWNNRRWRWALRLAFHPWVLRLSFDRTAAAALPTDFSTFIGRRLQDWLTAGPARTNPFLWQTFLGEYPSGLARDDPSDRPLYLRPDYFEGSKCHLQKITWSDGEAAEILARGEAGAFDLIALSNILELASEARLARTLEAATHAAAPGAFLLLRGILPQRLDRLPGGWRRLDEAVERTNAEDRGGLCLPIGLWIRSGGGAR